jgi:hypothetical protein
MDRDAVFLYERRVKARRKRGLQVGLPPIQKIYESVYTP